MSKSYEAISSSDGRRFQAYVSEPAQPNGHAVIVLQEIFGVTRQVRGIADRFSEDGYLAFAPDLFWRQEAQVELSHSKEEMQRAFELLAAYRDEDGIADIASTAAHIRARHGFAGRVAAAGMCLGGKLAYLGASLKEIDAAVGYYGVGIEKRLDIVAQLRAPLQLHFGGRDKYVSEAARTEIAAALRGKEVEVHVYPQADHGFYTRGSQEDIDAARARTNVFLARTLKA